MGKKSVKTAKQELETLCAARRQAITNLQQHLGKNDGSSILAKKYEAIVADLEKEICNQLEIWFGTEK